MSADRSGLVLCPPASTPSYPESSSPGYRSFIIYAQRPKKIITNKQQRHVVFQASIHKLRDDGAYKPQAWGKRRNDNNNEDLCIYIYKREMK